MSATDIRYKLHHFIESMDDERAFELYILLQNEIEDDEPRRALISTERENYLNGNGRSYSWEDVKNMALQNTISKRPY